MQFSLCVLGLSHTAGLYCRKDVRAPQDADAIARMREAGAIPFAITNVSEVCMWWESNNTVYGRSNNPYNTNHIVGGSSGGEVRYNSILDGSQIHSLFLKTKSKM
jgi:fatty acid amide hydrolase 2